TNLDGVRDIMISCGDAQEYVPFGREYIHHHPGEVRSISQQSPPPPHLDLLRQLDTVSINGSKDWWEIRLSKDGLTEEELYVTGSTLVWSRGQAGHAGSRQIIKCMTCDSPIQHVTFTTFYTYPDQPALLGEAIPEEPTGDALPCICIVESDTLSIFSEDGEDFSVALPFPVRKIWSCKYGIVLERQVPGSEIASPKCERDRLPLLYSLLHPLNEINPLLSRSGYSGSGGPAYMNDLVQQVVFVSEDPSICILYNTSNNSHTFWKVRRASTEENNLVLQSSTQASVSGQVASNVFSNPSSLIHFSTQSPSFSQSHQASPGPPLTSLSPTPTSLRTRSSVYANLLSSPKTQLTPTPKSHMATLSRTQSPSLFGSQNLRILNTPSPSRSPGPCSPRFSLQSFLNETMAESEPLIPDICFDHLWTDNSSARATKAFLTENVVGQKYVCLMLSQSGILRCIKYDFTNDHSSLIFGSISSIPARDALPIKALKMMIVVDGSGSLSLYTGISLVSRINLSGFPVFNSSLFKDFSSLNISSCLQSPSTPPYHRYSLLTSSRPTSAVDPKFDIGISPVITEKSHMDNSFADDPALPFSSAIIAFRDPTDYRVTLEHASGNFYRITLPEVASSPLVRHAIAALKYILPRESALLLVNKWYATRNAPGSEDFSPQGEWTMFSTMLLSMIGYDTDRLALTYPVEASGSCSPLVATKKFRAAESGSDNDWEYILSSAFHMAAGHTLSEMLGLQRVGVIQKHQEDTKATANTKAPLFAHLPSVLFALHLVYEEFKLNTLHWGCCSLLVTCLHQLASDMRAKRYLHHYWQDFPTLCPSGGSPTQIPVEDSKSTALPTFFTESPPHILGHLYAIMGDMDPEPFPCIPEVCTSIKNMVLLYSVAATNCSLQDIPTDRFLLKINPSGQKSFTSSNVSMDVQCQVDNHLSIHEKIVLLTDQLGLSVRDIQLLSPGVSLVLMNAQHMCRTCPPQDWPESAYHLIHRPDLVVHREEAEKHGSKIAPGRKIKNHFNIRLRCQRDSDSAQEVKKLSQYAKEENDGMETLDIALLGLRWNKDQRIPEVRRMLSSSRAVTINIVQRPEVSDHDFLEEQERHLYALCIRTMALPIGRGMFTLCSTAPVLTETLPIPKLNLSGKAPPRGTTIDLSSIEVPPNMDMWPHFHNGVAAGLKIAPNCGEIDSTWIVYNKPKGSLDNPTEHAGFLMALGLNGHLRNLATVNMHDYLERGHEMTSVGLLLGISVAKRGTMDIQTTKLLSVHLECLLPPTSTELDVPHTVQVGAVIGVGLVYQDTAHRHIAEVLLQEIGRPPGPEMENSSDRESYSLAAGLALGLVMFGRGGEAAGFTDLNIAGELYHYIEGGHKRPLFGNKEKKSPSYQIKEGDCVNIDVTAPGATLALGMIYFRSNNKAIAEWMVAPSTPYLLDQVQPDFLLLRTIALGLILWDDVVPTSQWIESHVPATVLTHVHRGGNNSTPGIDYESMHQAYYNILAGACMVIGLKFAGSASSEAFQILWKFTRMFTNFTKRSVAELAGKSTIETCLNVILLSLSMVMAGTGDLDVLRIIRYLRSRIGPSNSTVGYGSHLTIHMALGFLFLGGGRFSLGTSNMAIAALLIACFPKFPTHSNDNRYHLQALRHLYVLAAEPRLLMPVDVDTKRLCQVHVSVRFKDTEHYNNKSYDALAPLMLPELSKLSEVVIEGNTSMDRYWTVR
ncbi:Anaphase-promoting complex subunit 1, partial [Halocaridina rubra]